MSEYPSDWNLVPIREIISESRIDPELDDPSKRISVRLHCEGVEKRSERATDQAGATRYYKRLAGQFIYGKQNLHKGAVGIVPNELHGFCSSQDIPAFDITQSVDPNWFLHLFRQRSFYESLESIATGTGSKRIQPSELGEKEIAVPPLPEQKKIAEILSGIDNTIEKLKKKKAKHQSLLVSMRQEIFNEESTNTCRFDQIVWERMLGTTRRGAGNGESIPLVKMGDITRGDIKLGENERIQYGDDLDELLLQRGDILFNTRNTPALVGKTAIYDSDERCTYDNNLMRIRVAQSNDPWYLNHLMNSPQFLRLLTRITAGTTSVAAIYWNDLRRLEIPLPPITRQKQIARSIQSVLSVIYDLSAETCCLEELRNALSSDLLSGRKRVSV